MSRIKSQLRYGWPETRASATHVVGLTVQARRLAEATLAELARLGVTVAIDDEGKARFRSTRAIPPIARQLIETRGDLLESYLKGGQDL